MRIGIGIGGVGASTDRLAGLATKDAASNKYVPANASEWTLVRAVAGISSGNPTSLWLCQEVSGDLFDSIGANTLLAGSSPLNQQPSAGWTRRGAGTSDGVAASGFSSTTIQNLATTSGLLLAYVALTGAAAAEREVMGMGSTGDHRYVAVTAGGKYKAAGLGGSASSTGAATPGTTVRPVVLQVNRAASAFNVCTDQEVLTPAWTAPSGGDALLKFGDALGTGAGPVNYLYGAFFSGAAAEMSLSTIRTLLQTLGWTVDW